MSNFYRDNKDIENVIDALDLTEVATLLEEDFRFAKEYDFAPKDAADAIDNYKRALDVCGAALESENGYFAKNKEELHRILSHILSLDRASGRRREIPSFLL